MPWNLPQRMTFCICDYAGISLFSFLYNCFGHDWGFFCINCCNVIVEDYGEITEIFPLLFRGLKFELLLY